MKILTVPNPQLNVVAQPYDLNDEKTHKEIIKLVKEMTQTMLSTKTGVGLAAPQVGVAKRLFIIDTKQKGFNLMVFINPEIIKRRGITVQKEGCLSVPGETRHVKRAEKIRLRYYDQNFEMHNCMVDGILARVVQHEYDHLDGILITDKK